MTQDEVIELARQVGFRVADQFAAAGTDEDMVAFAKLVAAKEREECARICETGASTPEELFCAKLIRARERA